MLTDTASIRIDADADDVFRFMADPDNMKYWSLGTWETQHLENELIEGRALATGDAILLKIDADADRLLVDYHLGDDPDNLCPRIFARIIPGNVTGHDNACAILILVGLRNAEMDDDRWASLRRLHAAELDIIKGQIETGYRPRKP